MIRKLSFLYKDSNGYELVSIESEKQFAYTFFDSNGEYILNPNKTYIDTNSISVEYPDRITGDIQDVTTKYTTHFSENVSIYIPKSGILDRCNHELENFDYLDNLRVYALDVQDYVTFEFDSNIKIENFMFYVPPSYFSTKLRKQLYSSPYTFIYNKTLKRVFFGAYRHSNVLITTRDFETNTEYELEIRSTANYPYRINAHITRLSYTMIPNIYDTGYQMSYIGPWIPTYDYHVLYTTAYQAGYIPAKLCGVTTVPQEGVCPPLSTLRKYFSYLLVYFYGELWGTWITYGIHFNNYQLHLNPRAGWAFYDPDGNKLIGGGTCGYDDNIRVQMVVDVYNGILAFRVCDVHRLHNALTTMRDTYTLGARFNLDDFKTWDGSFFILLDRSSCVYAYDEAIYWFLWTPDIKPKARFRVNIKTCNIRIYPSFMISNIPDSIRESGLTYDNGSKVFDSNYNHLGNIAYSFTDTEITAFTHTDVALIKPGSLYTVIVDSSSSYTISADSTSITCQIDSNTYSISYSENSLVKFTFTGNSITISTSNDSIEIPVTYSKIIRTGKFILFANSDIPQEDLIQIQASSLWHEIPHPFILYNLGVYKDACDKGSYQNFELGDYLEYVVVENKDVYILAVAKVFGEEKNRIIATYRKHKPDYNASVERPRETYQIKRLEIDV